MQRFMKITSWNCCLKLGAKAEAIHSLRSDVAVIQECEQLSQDHFEGQTFHWVGHNTRKGLGIIAHEGAAKRDKSFNSCLDYFLPLNFDCGLKVLGVWSFTHRAKARFGDGHKGHVSDAINHYYDWLCDSDRSIVCGDFNNSVIWDKGDKESNFSNTNERLQKLGFESVFHKLTHQAFGEESIATFYHTKQQQKPYHIDYLFVKGGNPISHNIGAFEDWIRFSDHMPITAEIQF